jgi:hypothetical protein
MTTFLGGPMFESSNGSVFRKQGAHYNIFHIPRAEAMAQLRQFFPDGEANELNFVLFSTSGVHGSYGLIEDIGVPYEENEEGEAGAPNDVTFLIVQPRLVCMRYGNAKPEGPDDIAFLKKLRESSWAAVQKIGKP